MDGKQKDRHLDVPAEANRDKHINFVTQERSETDPARESSAGPLAIDSADASSKKKHQKKKNSKGNKM